MRRPLPQLSNFFIHDHGQWARGRDFVEQMTKAEFEKLGDDRGEYRLSCQIACDRDMTLDVLMKVSD